MKKNTELFIKDVIKIHGNKYDCSKVNYVNNKTPISNMSWTCGKLKRK